MTHHAGPRRSIVRRLAIVLALAAAVTGLSQCRLTNDSITGVDLRNEARLNGGGDGRSCVRRCNERLKITLILESIRHRAALKACRHDRQCRADENGKHDRIVGDIRVARDRCKRDCYNEGGGIGGHPED